MGASPSRSPSTARFAQSLHVGGGWLRGVPRPIHDAPFRKPPCAPRSTSMIPSQVKELLLRSLEHERSAVLVYRTALECAVNEQLKAEWDTYFDQTERHVS